MSGDRVTLFPDVGCSEAPHSTTGTLPSQKIRQLVSTGRITAPVAISDEQIQPASIDLRLGPIAYRVRASFLPGRHSRVDKGITELTIAEIDLSKPAVFEKGAVLVVPLMESISLPTDTLAKANPKSTTGRLDVFTRLITDYGTEFDWVQKGYTGPLFLEIVSRTFAVIVEQGTRLNQLRFIRGNGHYSDTRLVQLDEREALVYGEEDTPEQAMIKQGLRISVDLKGRGQEDVVAYRARKNAPPIEFSKKNYYDATEFWDAIGAPRSGHIILDPGDFYLLASRERVRVPPDFAAEMVPFDPSFGELRVHYAGFFDPGFGYGLNDIPGTKAVLEVRAHEVPVVLEHGQVIGRLLYSPMMGTPEKVYGVSIGSSYQKQGLTLSKQFRKSG